VTISGDKEGSAAWAAAKGSNALNNVIVFFMIDSSVMIIVMI
jgi:hypothetical protein